MQNHIKTYEPDNCLKQGYFSIFRQIVNEIKESKWLIYQLFKRDFSATYRQSVFGLLWVILIPVIGIAGVFLLSRSNIIDIGKTPVSFLLYSVSGLAIWQIFSVGLVSATSSLAKAGPMIVKINFSKKALVISAFSQCFVPFLVLFAVALLLCPGEGVKFSAVTLLFPFLLIPLILFTLGLGFLLALLNGLMRDIGNAVSVLVTFLMFFTPIFYAAPKAGSFYYAIKYNPLYYLIIVPRDALLTGSLEHLLAYYMAAILSVIVFVFCIAVFHITETRIAERI